MDASQPLLSTRNFGGVRVSVVHTGTLYVNPRYPPGRIWRTDDTPVDSYGWAVHGSNSLIIQTAGATVVVDPGSFRPDETSLYGGRVRVDPGPPLGVALDRLAIEPEAVTRVLITHGHDDHLSGVLDGDQVRFANAEHTFPMDDWDDIHRGDFATAAESQRILAPLKAGGNLRLVSGDVDLGDGLALVSTPGETRGHQIVRLDAGGERLYYLGDLFHSPIEFQKLRWAGSPRSELVYQQFAFARRRVLEEAIGKRSTLVFTHGIFPAWGIAEQLTPEAWIWRYT